MPTEADVVVVRRLYSALARGDLTAVGECFRPDAVWHLPGTSRIAGTHRGWPAIRDDFFAKQGPLSGGTFRAQLLDLAVGAEYIVAVGKGTGEHAGRRLDVTVCQLMRVQDGKIVEVRGHYSDQTALDAFWGPSRQ
jgi:ketosteroid isomerase-like protein